MGDDVRTTLERLIAKRRETYAGLSALLDRNPAYMHQFMKRGTPRKLDEGDRRVLAQYFGVSEEILGGPPQNAHEWRASPDMEAIAKVPRIDLGASAGTGSQDDRDYPIGEIAFDAHWLTDLGLKPHGISIIRVDGDSMAPTLGNGDDIMVNHQDGAAMLRDGIYVLRLDNVLMVKRVALGPRRGSINILSDNPQFPDWTDFDPSLLVVVGRVVWTCRKVR